MAENSNIEWTDIPNYVGFYKISEYGEVKSLERKVKNGNGFRRVNEKILYQSKDKDGYARVTLSKHGKIEYVTIHILVAISFLNFKKGCGLTIDHIDNNIENNHYSNLQVLDNRINASKQTNKKSKLIGATKHNGKYSSRITIKGKVISLGYFETEQEAHDRYMEELKSITH